MSILSLPANWPTIFCFVKHPILKRFKKKSVKGESINIKIRYFSNKLSTSKGREMESPLLSTKSSTCINKLSLIWNLKIRKESDKLKQGSKRNFKNTFKARNKKLSFINPKKKYSNKEYNNWNLTLLNSNKS